MSSGQNILSTCLRLLIRPIASFCVKRSLKYSDFSEIAKEVFVEVAEGEILKSKQKVSASRVSVITGLQRRDVARLQGEEQLAGCSERNLVTRIVGQWVGDRSYSNKAGKPRQLTFEGVESEFVSLVHRVSKDLNAYAVLFELERIGAVRRQKGKLELCFFDNQVRSDVKESFAMLSRDITHLIQAVEENTRPDFSPPNLHATTVYDNVEIDKIPVIRRWFMEFGRRAHAEARAFLARYDRDINGNSSKASVTKGAKVVLGTFSHISCDMNRAEETRREKEK